MTLEPRGSVHARATPEESDAGSSARIKAEAGQLVIETGTPSEWDTPGTPGNWVNAWRLRPSCGRPPTPTAADWSCGRPASDEKFPRTQPAVHARASWAT